MQEVFDRELVVPGKGSKAPGQDLQRVLVGGWTRQPLSNLFLRIGFQEGIVLTDGQAYLKWECADARKGRMFELAALLDSKWPKPYESYELNPATQFVAACETYELIALASDKKLHRI